MLSSNDMEVLPANSRIKVCTASVRPGLVLWVEISWDKCGSSTATIIRVELGRNTEGIEAGKKIY